VVGLGTGTIAAYGEKGEYFRFYDINPDVLKLSDMFFTYLKDSEATTEVVIGDARITMERELADGKNQQFDVLAIDAFSSDAIPVHLLTSECGDIYRQHLRPGGILAIHISNRFLDLNPVSRGMAEHLGWQAIRIENGNNNLTGVFSSTWILLTSSKDLAGNASFKAAEDPWKEDERILHWTDDYSGLWQVLSF
jgi:spermidine synthase